VRNCPIAGTSYYFFFPHPERELEVQRNRWAAAEVNQAEVAVVNLYTFDGKGNFKRTSGTYVADPALFIAGRI